MITNEMINKNIVMSGKTLKVLELVGEIRKAQATLQEKLFQLDDMINDRALRRPPETALKLLPEPKDSHKKSSRKKSSHKPSKTGRTRRAFSDEFKAEMVAKVLEQGEVPAHVAREYDLTESTFRYWILRAQKDSEKTPNTGKASRKKEPPKKLPEKLTAACDAIKSKLKSNSSPVSSAVLTALRGHKKTTIYKALVCLKEQGEIAHSKEGSNGFYSLIQGGTKKQGRTKKSSKSRAATPEVNSLFHDPFAEEMRKARKKFSVRAKFSTDLSEQMQAYSREKSALGFTPTQIAHALGVTWPAVGRWLRLGIYNKIPLSKE